MIERETVPPLVTGPDDIHHSIADADDIEEVWDERIAVTDVIRNLITHPGQIITRWNWKTALLGAVVRASFYFTVYKASRESWMVTLTAVLVEFTFRFITTGMAGSVVQSFRRASPLWLANVIVSISLPAFSHSVEFITHYAQEHYFSDIFATAGNSLARQRTFAISVLFSVISALFNLFAMKHGVLLVGAGNETRSLFSDIKQIPRMLGEFTAVLPVMISEYLENARVLNALMVFGAFGLAVGTILGTVRGSWRWAWTTAAGAWGFLFVAIAITLFARLMMRRNGRTYTKRY